MPVNLYTDEEIATLSKLRRQLVPTKDIAAAIGRPHSSVRDKLKSLGRSYPSGRRQNSFQRKDNDV